MLEDSKWSRGDTGRTAKAQKISVEFTFHAKGMSFVKENLKTYDVSSSYQYIILYTEGKFRSYRNFTNCEKIPSIDNLNHKFRSY